MAGGDVLPAIRATPAVYLVAVVALSTVGAASLGWIFGAFREAVSPFLLVPAALFPAVLCLRPFSRDSADAAHPG